MNGANDLATFLSGKDYRLIIAADAETFVTSKTKQGMITSSPAGGVAIAFDPIAKISHGLFVARGKTEQDKESADKKGKILSPDKSYTLKRLFFNHNDFYNYYYGFSNQTLWPLCHVAFERPIFSSEWYESFKKINMQFAKGIAEEIKGKTFIWVNDYQLSLVPKYLGKQKDTILGFFWHIPWPTWEIFRILPQKREILESLLMCDLIAFHRGYHVRNFLQTVDRELQVRIDLETNTIYYKDHATTVKNLPMGVDTDVITSLLRQNQTNEKLVPQEMLKNQRIILGVDRLDYTKGLLSRLNALDLFFEKNPQFREKVTYLELLAPSRDIIPSYVSLKKQFFSLAQVINEKYQTKKWQPIQIVNKVFPREQLIEYYKNAAVCLVTPLDDGMNLVSKEFVIASSFAEKPGMLVLSQFAGSAIDLTSALIVNSYNKEEVSQAIKQALEMPDKERKNRIQSMAEVLQERNVYQWAESFLREAEAAAKEKKR